MPPGCVLDNVVDESDVAKETLNVLRKIRKSLDQKRRESRRLRQTIDNLVSRSPAITTSETPNTVSSARNTNPNVNSAKTPIMCKGLNLLNIEGTDPAKFELIAPKRCFRGMS